MKTKVNIANVAQKKVFWDMDMNKLSAKEDKDVIIPRMLLATNEKTFRKDIASVEKVYTANEIYAVLKNTKERISNQVCRMVAARYNKPTFLRYKF
ncbi:DUF6922 domain-containing protein [Marinirhabdus gelatinilytica]|uniref:DUF6922 domain-containing protein n=1 Tax=Marinirhabdus gelatinilytica TaxID=1703343 RepID=A0A370QG94_9FLAO|nr:hypothetical protein [Marinirhabdus gelatinilytica]RDK87376.1 hypothetical protein C8D94_102563 [Marinirhabdus gelatinilytica]